MKRKPDSGYFVDSLFARGREISIDPPIIIPKKMLEKGAFSVQVKIRGKVVKGPIVLNGFFYRRVKK